MHVKISNGLNSVFHKIQDYASLLPSPIASILSSVSRHSIQSVVGRGRRTETVSSLEDLFVRRPSARSQSVTASANAGRKRSISAKSSFLGRRKSLQEKPASCPSRPLSGRSQTEAENLGMIMPPLHRRATSSSAGAASPGLWTSKGNAFFLDYGCDFSCDWPLHYIVKL